MSTSGAFTFPVVASAGRTDPAAPPLVVLLHGRGSNERDILALVEHLPTGLAYTAVRAPIAEGGGYAWFANRAIGRPVAASLRATMDWFTGWLDTVARHRDPQPGTRSCSRPRLGCAAGPAGHPRSGGLLRPPARHQ